MAREYKEVKGDLITLALNGEFDVIAHGCNCFCTMGAGIAPLMAKAFGCDKYPMEAEYLKGDINKLGTINFQSVNIPLYRTLPEIGKSRDFSGKDIIVVNAYTQYYYGKNSPGCDQPLDYSALELCMRKINHIFAGKHIGLPQIGCGLAGGKWEIVKGIIQKELQNCDVTVVIYEK